MDGLTGVLHPDHRDSLSLSDSQLHPHAGQVPPQRDAVALEHGPPESNS